MKNIVIIQILNFLYNSSKTSDNKPTPEEVANEITSPLWDVIETVRLVMMVVAVSILALSIFGMIWGNNTSNSDMIGKSKKAIIASVIGIGVLVSLYPIFALFNIGK